MAATKESVELTETIFDEAGLALDGSYGERVRQLGDSACKAGIEATIRYLSEKSELSDSELEMLSAGNIPEDLRQRDFDALIERLSQNADPKLDESEKSMCEDAFASGLSAAIHYLVKTAHTRDVDLLSLIPSTGE
jgi:hypothetical protein